MRGDRCSDVSLEILAIVLACLATLLVGFGMGVESVKKEISRYGCDAVQQTWKETP